MAAPAKSRIKHHGIDNGVAKRRHGASWRRRIGVNDQAMASGITAEKRHGSGSARVKIKHQRNGWQQTASHA